jgi:hypothetical protein
MTGGRRSLQPLIFVVAAALALATLPTVSDAQDAMPGMQMAPTQHSSKPPPIQKPPSPQKTSDTPPKSSTPSKPDNEGTEGKSVDRMDMKGDMSGMGDSMMAGATGGYSMMRDASGTAWQPESTPMEGWNGTLADWLTMLHGYVTGVYDHQGGPRGGEKTFSESMLMGMAQRKLGPGTLTLRAMLSLDPFMGKSGYPLLLQTGETADGVTPLVDRQHPHDLFMELAAIYSVPVGDKMSIFGYFGYPGEPALGPPTFMHRFSGMDDPAAPITHHWLDSTHITYGVVTGGLVDGDWKIEASAFHGREPNQFRWDFDSFALDSASARLSWNPTADWALQVSYGFIKSPEQLEPDVDQHRLTASATYNLPLDHGNWQTTVAWGRNYNHPGNTLDAFLLESTASWYEHTLFARVENVQKDELFLTPNPLAGQVFRVSSFSLGYVYDIPVLDHLALGLGAVGTVDAVPATIEPAYGSNPLSYLLFTRLKIK